MYSVLFYCILLASSSPQLFFIKQTASKHSNNNAQDCHDDAHRELAGFSEFLMGMLQRFYDGHVDEFDDIEWMQCVQEAMVHVGKYGITTRLTMAMTAAIWCLLGGAYGMVPSIEQLVILRDSRRRLRGGRRYVNRGLSHN
jgi:hypothetical protein